MTKQEAIEEYLKKNNIEITWQFLRKENHGDTFNYLVSLKKDNKEILETTYSMGYGYSPNYKKYEKSPRNYDLNQLKKKELKTGKVWTKIKGRLAYIDLKPDPVNVLHYLVLDAKVLDYDFFEEWAESLGYDSDSRKAESIYNEILKSSKSLLKGLGKKTLEDLEILFEDY